MDEGTLDWLVESLKKMRDAGPRTQKTLLFGLIFHDAIDEGDAKRIADEYNRRGHRGKVNHAVITDGRTLAKVADPHYDQVRMWRHDRTLTT